MSSDIKLAEAAAVIDRQSSLLRELHSYADRQAKTAAALAQAVKYAEDGLIDVSDIREYARRLKDEGNVKLSSVDDIFRHSPGDIAGQAAEANAPKLDPLSRVLRELSTSPTSIS